MLGIVLLAAALSIDSLGIGISYGMRGIVIPFNAKIIISIISAIFTAASLFIGQRVSLLLPPTYTKLLGVALLVFMGMWIILQGMFQKDSDSPEEKKETVFNIIIKSFRITIKIIKKPSSADLNKSNVIEVKEAVYIGTALSIDSIGAGIAAASLGLNNLFIPLAVALFQFLFLQAGIYSGKKLTHTHKNSKLVVCISGCLLIAVALMRMM